ncbi:MAG: hypothetical protein ABIJ31_15905, partial [Pseudomonadota bacterium]
KRIGKPDTFGEMTATVNEKDETHEENDCHPCSSGNRQGGRIYTRTSKVSASVNGLSDRTRISGETENHDATIHLLFDPNGTYNLHIYGTSKAADYKGKIIETAQGTCDSIKKTVDMSEDQLLQYNRSIPLTVRWTSFPGTPFDKRLVGKKQMVQKDTITGEETILTIDFDLQRK